MSDDLVSQIDDQIRILHKYCAFEDIGILLLDCKAQLAQRDAQIEALREAREEQEEWLHKMDAALKAADDLARETERRINDLGGYDGRFPVRQALTAYRKARGQDAK